MQLFENILKSREIEIINLFESMSRPSEKVFKYFFFNTQCIEKIYSVREEKEA